MSGETVTVDAARRESWLDRLDLLARFNDQVQGETKTAVREALKHGATRKEVAHAAKLRPSELGRYLR